MDWGKLTSLEAYGTTIGTAMLLLRRSALDWDDNRKEKGLAETLSAGW